jgi:hypothetical protein
VTFPLVGQCLNHYGTACFPPFRGSSFLLLFVLFLSEPVVFDVVPGRTQETVLVWLRSHYFVLQIVAACVDFQCNMTAGFPGLYVKDSYIDFACSTLLGFVMILANWVNCMSALRFVIHRETLCEFISRALLQCSATWNEFVKVLTSFSMTMHLLIIEFLGI